MFVRFVEVGEEGVACGAGGLDVAGYPPGAVAVIHGPVPLGIHAHDGSGAGGACGTVGARDGKFVFLVGQPALRAVHRHRPVVAAVGVFPHADHRGVRTRCAVLAVADDDGGVAVADGDFVAFVGLFYVGYHASLFERGHQGVDGADVAVHLCDALFERREAFVQVVHALPQRAVVVFATAAECHPQRDCGEDHGKESFHRMFGLKNRSTEPDGDDGARVHRTRAGHAAAVGRHAAARRMNQTKPIIRP